MLSRSFALVLALCAAAAGCVNTPAEGLEAASTELSADAPLLPSTDEIPGDIVLSLATPVRTINNGGEFLTVISLKDNTTGFVLELEWTAATPTAEQLSMWVRPAGSGSVGVPPDPAALTGTEGPLAQVDGASPLRLALPADMFPEPGDYDVVIRASAQPVGAAVDQPFTIYATQFEGLPFDDAYSALGATNETA